MKVTGIISTQTCIAWNVNKKLLIIRTDGGRMCRPIFLVRDNKLTFNKNVYDKFKNKKWFELSHEKDIKDRNTCNINEEEKKITNMDDYFIEYIDVDESNTSMIAMTEDNIKKNSKENDAFYKYTHCEIHPSLIYGVVLSTIPFSDHNQAPRDIFTGAQSKQGMGLYSTAFKHRMDTESYIMHYPQKPFCMPKTAKYINNDKIPWGENCIVAVACYTGYNQEDSLIFNKGSIDRGLMNANHYLTIKDEEEINKKKGEKNIFMKPIKNYPDGRCKTDGMSFGSYDKLDKDGFPIVGSHVYENDAVIGKVLELNNFEEEECDYKDMSTLIPPHKGGIVDKVVVEKNSLGNKVCKVKIKREKVPEMGDKFASRHGQKGTIGMMYNDEDMPFTKSGLKPDIIMNPHAFPKRQTIGHLIECAFSKVGALAGTGIDATSFRKINIGGAGEILKHYGFKKSGCEVLYNGKTGKQIKADIFIGPTFYYRLKHLVSNKIHSRDRGPRQLLTKQATEGRSRLGGLRIGEMERDSLLGNGTVQFLKERLVDCGDKYFVWIDEETGLISPVNPTKNIYKSLYSDNKHNFKKVNIPYTSKLLIQELMAMHIVPRIEVKNNNFYKIYINITI